MKKILSATLLIAACFSPLAHADGEMMNEALTMKFSKEIGFGINKEKVAKDMFYAFKIPNLDCMLRANIPAESMGFISAGKQYSLKNATDALADHALNLVDSNSAVRARLTCAKADGAVVKSSEISIAEVEKALATTITKQQFKRYEINYDGADLDDNSGTSMDI